MNEKKEKKTIDKLKIYDDIKRITFGIFNTLIILVPTLYFGFTDKLPQMGIAVVAGCLSCAFINLDKFSHIKGAGFEGDLKDKIHEVEITLRNLQKVIKPLVKYTLITLIYSDRGMWEEKQEEARTQIIESVEALSLDGDRELLDLFSTYERYKIWDKYVSFQNAVFRDTYNFNKYEVVSNELKDLIDKSRSSTQYPTESQIDCILKKHDYHLNDLSLAAYSDYIACMKKEI